MKELEIGKGWHQLAEPIIEAAKELNVTVHQVKEKFGGLRIYLGKPPNWLQSITEQMERLSYHVCEECGKEGKPRQGSWIKTLCDKCYERRT